MVERWSKCQRWWGAKEVPFSFGKTNPDVLWASGSNLIAFGQKLSIVKLSSNISVLCFLFSVFRSPFTPSGFCYLGGLIRGFAALHPCLWSPHPFGVSVLRSPFSVLSSQFFTLITRRIPMSADSFEPNAKWRAVLRR